MFGIGLPELGVIALVALLILGPDKLPGLAKQAGAFLRAAKKFSDGARDELRTQLGPEYADLELTDLHPRTLARKHITSVMNEDDAPAEKAPAATAVVEDDDEEDDLPERVAYRKEQERSRR